MNIKKCVPCPRCGGGATRKSIEQYGACFNCHYHKEQRSPHLAGKGHKHSDRTHRCKMPSCRKLFKLRQDQDPRYTWYCHDCRERLATISDGVNWLNDMGLEVPPGEE